MTTLTNSFEGGTNGAAVTVAGSGGASGNAFDTVTIGTGATDDWDNAHAAHGVLANNLQTGATAAVSNNAWNTSLGSGISQIWFRQYLYFTANPGTSFRIFNALATVGGSLCAAVTLNNTGKLVFLNSASATIFTTTASIPLNQWFRIEGFIIGSATVGQVELKLFKTPDSLIPNEIDTSAATQNTRGTMSDWHYGITNSLANVVSFWQDELGLSNTGYLGPVASGTGSLPLRGPRAAAKGKLASILIKPPTTGGPPAPFFAPHTLLRGAPDAVKGKLTAGRGRAGVPSPFRLPGPLHGPAAPRKDTLTGIIAPPPPVLPSVPAPFFAPHSPLRPPPVPARAGRLTAGRGRAGIPSPFRLPRVPLHGQPAARKGTLAGIAAPPPIIPPNIPAPFFAPHTLLRGQVPVMARTRSVYIAAPPPAPPPQPLAAWQGSTHIVAADASGNLIQGARHVGKGGPGPDLKGDYERSGD